jgi:hypothetical protein
MPLSEHRRDLFVGNSSYPFNFGINNKGYESNSQPPVIPDGSIPVSDLDAKIYLGSNKINTYLRQAYSSATFENG